MIEAQILKAKEERMNQIRNSENRIFLQKVPFAQRSRMMNQLRQEQSRQDSAGGQLDNAESGSVGQQSSERLPGGDKPGGPY